MQKHFICVNEIQLAVYEYECTKGNPKGSAIFFHANGFHARCWDRIIARLPEIHCWALDTRGHGQSDKPTPHNPWQEAGRDASAVVRALGLKNALGVGHSLGGNMLIRAAATVPEAFSALLLIDPVVFAKKGYFKHSYMPETHFVNQRRNEWRDADEMFERFVGRGPFRLWQREILRDYCDYCLIPNPHGEGFVLACHPLTEAHTYTSAQLIQNADIYEHIARINHPVRVLCCSKITDSTTDLSASPTTPDLADHFKHGEDICLPEPYTHLIPMEDPTLIAEHVRQLLCLTN
jgi:pimeloyl-ACP methyl ester carboxylesterase